MQKIIYYAAILSNIVLMFGAVYFISQSFTLIEILVASLMFLPPVLSLIALYTGPDLEEKRLQRMLNKMKIKKELQDIKAGRS